MTEGINPESRLAEIRRAFDRSFSLPIHPPQTDLEDFLGLRVAEDACAVRVAHLSGIIAATRLVPLPTTAPGFLGLTAVRGDVVPVYGLRELLGYPPGEAPPRWFLLAGKGHVVGLACDEVTGHLRVARSNLAPRTPETHASVHFREVAHSGAQVHPILEIPSLIQTLAARARPGNPLKEQR